MKKPHKNLLSFIFISSLMLSYIVSSSLVSTYNHTIYTRITDISLPPVIVEKTFFPNHTAFEFQYTAEIINPSGIDLFIRTPTTCLVHNTGNITFENEQNDGRIIGGELFCGQAFTEHKIPPGITEGNLPLYISINGTVEALPNGDYTVWIVIPDCEDFHEYVNYPSIISVLGSNITVNHTGANETFSFPTISDFPYIAPFFLFVIFVGFIIASYLSRKR